MQSFCVSFGYLTCVCACQCRRSLFSSPCSERLGPLLYLVRFPAMTTSQLREIREMHVLLGEEMLAVLKHKKAFAEGKVAARPSPLRSLSVVR